MQREPVTRSGGRLLRWFSAGVLAAALSVLSAAAVSAQTATPEPGEESDAVTATKVITKTASQTGAETGPETDGETGPKTGQAEAGVLVVAVDPGSPAAAVGLARGDIILAAGETAVNSLDALRAVLLELRPGDTLNLTYRHGDDERQAEVTLGEQEGRAYLGVQLYNAHMMRAAPAMMLSALGLELPNTAVITATLMPTAAYTSGVVVASVVAGGPAEAAGLAAGDLITELDGEPIADGEALRAALARYAPGDEVTLTVHRGGPGGEEEEMAVTLGAAPDDAEQAFLGIQTLPKVAVVQAKQAVLPAPVYPALPYAAPDAMPYMMPYMMPYAVPYPAPQVIPYPMPGMPYGAPYVMPLLLPPPPVFVYGAAKVQGKAQADIFQTVPALPYGADVLFLRRGVTKDDSVGAVSIAKPLAAAGKLQAQQALLKGKLIAPALPKSLEPAALPLAKETL